mgnify:CR=1 FL=1|jgi:ABC-2 type transport system ATP-binding protein
MALPLTASVSQSAAIVVRGVSYRYANAAQLALHDVSFEVPRAEIFGLLGPNGAGKSTLLGLMSGSLRIQGGEISIEGESLARRARHVKRISAVVPQEYAFYEALTGRQNLAYFGSVFGLSRRERLRREAAAVEICRLQDHLDRAAGQYSGGLKRRLNLAIGLLNEPKILYLDEPTVGIDAESRRCILDAVKALQARGTTIVYTSHYMEEVEALCDSVAVIDRGRVVLHERVQSLLRREGAEQLQIVLTEPDPNVAQLLSAFSPTHVDHKVWSCTVPAGRLSEVLAELERRNVRYERLHYGVSRLEKIYLDLLLARDTEREATS